MVCFAVDWCCCRRLFACGFCLVFDNSVVWLNVCFCDHCLISLLIVCYLVGSLFGWCFCYRFWWLAFRINCILFVILFCCLFGFDVSCLVIIALCFRLCFVCLIDYLVYSWLVICCMILVFIVFFVMLAFGVLMCCFISVCFVFLLGLNWLYCWVFRICLAAKLLVWLRCLCLVGWLFVF